MKKLFILACAIVASSITVKAQSFSEAREIAKERKELAKLSRSQLNQKASKDARKEAKAFKKEGWQVNPGALPLEKQLDRSYLMHLELDSEMMDKYIWGEARSIGENYDAAKMQALELAKQHIAGQIQSEITALVENTVANKQLAAEEAASVTETVMASKHLISQRIGRTVTVVEAYRVLPNKNKEVLIRIAYDSKKAMDAGKQTIREELKAKGDELHEKLDKALGW